MVLAVSHINKLLLQRPGDYRHLPGFASPTEKGGAVVIDNIYDGRK